eukprot:scaffold23499_cov109-Cylindrotheca_fusiformis.AAC.1
MKKTLDSEFLIPEKGRIFANPVCLLPPPPSTTTYCTRATVQYYVRNEQPTSKMPIGAYGG